MDNQKVISLLRSTMSNIASSLSDEEQEAFEIAIKTINERKHGHWVRFADYEFDEYDEVGEACYRTIFRYKCSICNQGSYSKPNNHYCPNCGAIMDEVTE